MFHDLVKQAFKDQGFALRDAQGIIVQEEKFTRIACQWEGWQLDGTSVIALCEIIIKTGTVCSYDEVRYFRNRNKGLIAPTVYLVSERGFDRRSASYIKRYGGIRAMSGQDLINGQGLIEEAWRVPLWLS